MTRENSRTFFGFLGAIMLAGANFTPMGNAQEAEPLSPAKGLQRVDHAISGVVIDLRYATKNNFTGKSIYNPDAVAWLLPETILALRGVQSDLKRLGYRLAIFDAYRPPWAQTYLWKAKPNGKYVTPPSKGSRHSRGTSVDAGLADRAGKLLPMPTEFDAFVPEAAHSFMNLPVDLLRRRNALRSAMFRNGLTGVPAEWWHYDLRDWRKYPILEDRHPRKEFGSEKK